MIIDMHCDTISRLIKQKQDEVHTSLACNSLHIDLKKLKAGNYLLQNFALFVKLSKTSDPLLEVLKMIDLYYEELEKNKEMIASVLSYNDIFKNRHAHKISSLLTIEEGGVCKGSLAVLRLLYRLGVRMMTITWNFSNELGYPNLDVSKFTSPAEFTLETLRTPDTEHGLTAMGISFLEEMEHLGMIIDVSHLSDAGFYDVYHHTKKPFVASHSNARSICSFARNATDDMIRKISDSGGVIGLNFCPDFLHEISYLGEPNSGTIEDIMIHAKHIVKVGGIDCLALGSDFDGIDGHKELYDASQMTKLIDAFEKHGFTADEIEKVTSRNVLRVYKECLS